MMDQWEREELESIRESAKMDLDDQVARALSDGLTPIEIRRIVRKAIRDCSD